MPGIHLDEHVRDIRALAHGPVHTVEQGLDHRGRARAPRHGEPADLARVASPDPQEVVGPLKLRAGVTGGRPRLVLLYVDGKRVDHDTSSPFVFTWSSARVPNGRHTLELRVTARDGTMGAVRTRAP